LSVKNSFGLGGGSAKSRLVADLTDDYKKLNTVLKETEKLSKSIAGNLKGAASGGSTGGPGSMSSPTPPPAPSGPSGPSAPPGPPGPNGPGGPGGGASSMGGSSGGYGSAIRTMAGAAVTALASGIDSEQYITNDIARRRFGFFSGIYSRKNDNIGTIAGNQAFETMARRGTATSAMDAANAAMAGNSGGLMSGLGNYNTIMNSAAGVSNLMPGVGLEGGMGAISALNQGSSVNKLRMIGINVRDQKGFMRDVEDIARDLWKTINNTKTGSGQITESDLSYSLQSGNSLAMLMDQYFGTDAVLKQSVISYLYQFAKNGGKKIAGGYTSDAGKAELNMTGANPGITQSIGRRNAAGTSNINTFTSAGINGIQSANDTIANLTRITTALGPFVEELVTASTFSQTLGGAGNGTGGILIKGVIDTAKAGADASLEVAKAAKYVLIAAAVAMGVQGIIGKISQSTDNQWATAISKGQLNPNSDGPGWFNNMNSGSIYPDGGGGTDTGTTPDSSGDSSSAGSSKGSSGGGAGGSYTGIKPAFKMDKKGYATITMQDTRTGWSKKLLSKLGIKNPSAASIAAVNEWMLHENTASSGYLGTRNNPLNMKDSVLGTGLGKDASGSQVYATEDAGIADIAKQLLIGKSQGYTDIVKALSNPNASEDSIWSTIAGSQWSGSRYGSSDPRGMKYNGATFNINIPNAQNMDPKALSAAILDAIDKKAIQDAASGRARERGV